MNGMLLREPFGRRFAHYRSGGLMRKVWNVGIVALIFGLVANAAVAQTVGQSAAASPVVAPARKAARPSLVLPRPESLPRLKSQDASVPRRRDSVWNGALIGAGIGGGAGAIWGLGVCGSNDTECFAIAGPVGIIGGAAIGAAAGAIADALHD
jgi:hypothetical protein